MKPFAIAFLLSLLLAGVARAQPPADPAARLASLEAAISKKLATSRYMISESWCTAVDPAGDVAKKVVVAPYADAIAHAGADSAGARMLECSYSYARGVTPDVMQTGYAVLLDLPPRTLAVWIANACETEAAADFDGCAGKLVKDMIASNGGQYVIAGMVAEGVYTEGGKQHSLCVQKGKAVMETGLLAFRDGVTIQYRADAPEANGQTIYYCVTEPLDVAIQKSLAFDAAAAAVYHVGRVAAVRDSCWTETASGAAWQQVVRDSITTALKTGEDALFNRAAWLYAHPGEGCS